MGLNFQWSRFKLAVLSAIALGTHIAIATPVNAAETIIVRQGIMSLSLAIEDLETLANTGKAPPGLRGYELFLSPQQKQQVLAAFNSQIGIPPTAVRNLLTTQIGENILEEIATITRTPDPQTAGADIKTALLEAAENESGLSILGFLQSYPNSELRIDIDVAFDVFSRLNRSFWRTQQFMVEIAQQLGPTDANLTLPLDPTQPGPSQVITTTHTFEDTARNRTIDVDIYWSEAVTSDRPVVVFTHGRGSVRNELQYVARHLASHGYAFVTLEHPGSNQTYISQNLAMQPQELLERPQDISFVLDQLTQLTQTGGVIERSLNPNRVLVIGYSLGGGTALTIAGGEFQLDSLRQRCQQDAITLSSGQITQCIATELPGDRYRLYDPRIKAAIALNPTASLIFGETGLTQIRVPTLIFSTSADKLTPALSDQIAIFPQIPAPKWLVGVLGGTHLSAKDPDFVLDQSRVPSTPLSGDEVAGIAAADIQNYVKAFTLAIAAQLTPEAEKYQIFLTPEYFEFISTDAFPVRLITEIPEPMQILVDSFLKDQLP